MTAEDLKSLQLPEEALAQVLDLHSRELDALRTERDSLQRQLTIAEARDAALEERRREAVLREALLRRGAHPQAAGLLIAQCRDARWNDDGTLANEEALLEPIRQAWDGLFLREERLGTEPVTPPIHGGGRLSRESLRDMPPEEINRLWPDIRMMLDD